MSMFWQNRSNKSPSKRSSFLSAKQELEVAQLSKNDSEMITFSDVNNSKKQKLIDGKSDFKIDTDCQSTYQFTKDADECSHSGEEQSFKILNKNYRESYKVYGHDGLQLAQNEYQGHKVNNSKSVSFFANKNMKESIVLNKQTIYLYEKYESSYYIKALMAKIEMIYSYNSKLKSYNIKLRMIKLSTCSYHLQLIETRLYIQELKRKIYNLKSEFHFPGAHSSTSVMIEKPRVSDLSVRFIPHTPKQMFKSFVSVSPVMKKYYRSGYYKYSIINKYYSNLKLNKRINNLYVSMFLHHA